MPTRRFPFGGGLPEPDKSDQLERPDLKIKEEDNIIDDSHNDDVDVEYDLQSQMSHPEELDQEPFAMMTAEATKAKQVTRIRKAKSTVKHVAKSTVKHVETQAEIVVAEKISSKVRGFLLIRCRSAGRKKAKSPKKTKWKGWVIVEDGEEEDAANVDELKVDDPVEATQDADEVGVQTRVKRQRRK
ncbi:uncharacterized protein MELLADRAFT_79353 [Melampsora larici-populina 98AG31]|uniref:Uncharacterized protein n=1 Tax=Melampsora larici-populina (strain 98AG31 / pathotype 3-4-7) TaxID=747676 RepID=F4S5V0_MELLP|nr:uncharacterized protein MELLADRAFT_79353 [Melampsora larici-populina 98AG31]EGF99963.1 hypothetical protein MELLADRAFT_79353 [Melampsora larici-populina 98AG31]